MRKKTEQQGDLLDNLVTPWVVPISQEKITISGILIKKTEGEFWTSKQRQASTLHEVSYRACFKPQLPNYFITKYTKINDVVYDPFGGRGTTCIEAAILGRKVIQNDINPLSTILAGGRLFIPTISEVAERLEEIDFSKKLECDIDLKMFFHDETLNEILTLKDYLSVRNKHIKHDRIDDWIRMIATNRLTGHSPGFFSVYTMPPNQAVSAKRQELINIKRKQKPPYRNTRDIILKKTKQLIGGLTDAEIVNLKRAAESALFINNPAKYTPQIPSDSVSLVVTSPPFLNIVQYKNDNWLRCWFNEIDAEAVGRQITMSKTLDTWAEEMHDVLIELFRILKRGGVIAFEVGEVRNGKIKLDEIIIPLGVKAGFQCDELIINTQKFTKTSNIWGVSNNVSGTNSNRIVIFKK